MNIVKEHILQLLRQGMREDRRDLLEYRKPISVEYDVSSKSAEGSARVKIGDTEVVAGVKLEVGEPYPDSPDKGNLSVNVELLPLSNPEFESGPPGDDAVELARVVDRGLRESGCIDFEKLCIKKGEKVWTVCVDIYPFNDAGNLFDAAFLASVAALQSAKFPEYSEKSGINYEEKTNKKLPLNGIPIEVTVLKIQDKFIVDPTNEEWKLLDARLTVAVMDGKVCALQKGGEAGLTDEDLERMFDIAFEKSSYLLAKVKGGK